MTAEPERGRFHVGGLGDLLRLAWPVIFARLGIMAMGLTDAVVVGRYSADQLAFHALGWAPTSVVLATAVGLLSGVQVMAARFMGEGRPRQAGAVLRRGVVYAVWIGLGSAAFLYTIAEPLLAVLGLDPVLVHGAGRVARIFALSLPLYLVATAASSWLEGLSRPLPGMIVMWLANALNLGVNLLLVPGAFGLTPMGAAGAAWATLCARGLLALLLLVYIALMPDARALGVFARPVRDRYAEVQQRRIGYGAGAAFFAEVPGFAGLNIVAGWLGGLAVAGWTVVVNVTSLIFMVPLGLGAATAVLVGRAYGARDAAALRRVAGLGLAVSAVAALAISLAIWPGARLVASAYAADPRLIALAAPALVLAAVAFIPDALQVVAGMALRARGDVWAPTAVQVASYVLVMIPLGWALAHPFHLGLTGIVLAMIFSSYLSSSLLLARTWVLTRRDV